MRFTEIGGKSTGATYATKEKEGALEEESTRQRNFLTEGRRRVADSGRYVLMYSAGEGHQLFLPNFQSGPDVVMSCSFERTKWNFANYDFANSG